MSELNNIVKKTYDIALVVGVDIDLAVEVGRQLVVVVVVVELYVEKAKKVVDKW